MKRFFWGVVAATLPLQSFANGYDNNDFIDKQVFPINSLIVSAFILAGLVLIGVGLYDIKRNAENKNQHPISHAVSKMVAGMLLLSSSAAYHIFSGTVSNSTPSYSMDVLSINESDMLGQVGDLSNSWLGEYLPAQTIEMLIGIIFLFGVYSFLKGIYILKDMGAPKQQGQDSSPLKKSAIHIGAGMIAMNILDFACFVGNTLNMPFLCFN